jgi:hypothetical protein
MENMEENRIFHIISLFNLLFFHIFHIISHFNLPFFHIVHILSLFDLLFFHIFHIISQLFFDISRINKAELILENQPTRREENSDLKESLETMKKRYGTYGRNVS